MAEDIEKEARELCVIIRKRRPLDTQWKIVANQLARCADTIAALRRDLAASDAAMAYILDGGSLYADHPLAEYAESMIFRHRARQAAAAKEE